MYWNTWSDFWAMGGYGLYVWGSYACVLVWLLLEPLLERRAHKRALSQISDDAE